MFYKSQYLVSLPLFYTYTHRQPQLISSISLSSFCPGWGDVGVVSVGRDVRMDETKRTITKSKQLTESEVVFSFFNETSKDLGDGVLIDPVSSLFYN